jgi:prevent-host-death family protein
MRTATAKDLRLKTALLLDEVRRGEEIVITHRGKSVAVLAPITRADRKALSPIGFGMWRGRKDVRDVERWLERLREPRHAR